MLDYPVLDDSSSTTSHTRSSSAVNYPNTNNKKRVNNKKRKNLNIRPIISSGYEGTPSFSTVLVEKLVSY